MIKHGVFDRFFALLAKMPGADKEDLIWSASGMLTTSLREFHEKNPEGYKRMLANMQVEVNKITIDNEQKIIIKSLRSSILTRLQKHGVDTTDWKRINKFLEQPRISGKRLYDMSIDEMRALIPKLESILAKDAKIKNREHDLTLMN